jgi:hypothetical protein
MKGWRVWFCHWTLWKSIDLLISPCDTQFERFMLSNDLFSLFKVFFCPWRGASLYEMHLAYLEKDFTHSLFKLLVFSQRPCTECIYNFYSSSKYDACFFDNAHPSLCFLHYYQQAYYLTNLFCVYCLSSLECKLQEDVCLCVCVQVCMLVCSHMCFVQS